MPLSGAEPECALRPCAVTLSVPAALRRTTTASRSSSASCAGLEAQARVEALEARDVDERRRRATPRRRPAAARPPRTRARARRARAERRARARRRPSCRSRPSPGAARRRACSGRCSSWATTVSRWPTSSSRREPEPRQARRAGRRRDRARSTAIALDRRLVRRQRRDERGGLLRAVHVAAGRRDRDERLELALGAGRDGGGVLCDPRLHGFRTLSRNGLCTARGRSRPRLRPGGHGRDLPPLRPPRAARRAALLSRATRPPVCTQAVLLLPRPLRRHERTRRGGRRHLPPGPRLARGVHRSTTG